MKNVQITKYSDQGVTYGLQILGAKILGGVRFSNSLRS